jgi:glycosyltransferase involved in cell wall biosynthesis
VGGNPELVHTGENGLTVPPGDAPALAAALAALARDPERRQRMGAAARARFATGEFSHARVAALHLAAYQHAADRFDHRPHA